MSFTVTLPRERGEEEEEEEGGREGTGEGQWDAQSVRSRCNGTQTGRLFRKSMDVTER